MTGAVLEEEGYVYFKFQPYFDDLKRNEWKKDEQRTSHMLETYFQAEFSQLKRYPGKDKNGKYFPAIRCAKLPLDIFKKEKRTRSYYNADGRRSSTPRFYKT